MESAFGICKLKIRKHLGLRPNSMGFLAKFIPYMLLIHGIFGNLFP